VFVFEFAAPAEITSLAFEPRSSESDSEADSAAQSVRVETSTQGQDSGYSTLGDYSLQVTSKLQNFPLSHPVTARWLKVTLQQRGADHTSIALVVAFGHLQPTPPSKPLSGVWLWDKSPHHPDDVLFKSAGGTLPNSPDPALAKETYWMLQINQHDNDLRGVWCHTTGRASWMGFGSQTGTHITWDRSDTPRLDDGVVNAEGNMIVGADSSPSGNLEPDASAGVEQTPYVLLRVAADPDCAHIQKPVGSGQNILVLTEDGTFGDHFAPVYDELGSIGTESPKPFPGYRSTPLAFGLFTPEALTGVDVVVLGWVCDMAKKIAPWQAQALLDFTAAGHKLIIDDADVCKSTDYSFLPYQFRTSNPGAKGAAGHNLILVEPSTLGNDAKDSKEYVDLESWRLDTGNQIGDANTVTTKDPHWCGHLFGTNALNVNGFMHMYAPFGQGLIIFNGFDWDDVAKPTYRKVWQLELQQPVPALLPCTEPVAAKFLVVPSKSVPFAPGRASQVQVPLQVLANQGYAGTVSLAPKAPADAPWKTQLSVSQVILKGDTAPLTFTIDVPANASMGAHEFLVTGNDTQGNTASATITLVAMLEVASIQTQNQGCTRRLTVGSDALFAFNQATLTPIAQKTLAVLGPEIKKAGQHPVQIFGYTDSIGSESYNQTLSERRAQSVRDWLVAHHFLTAGTPIQGLGKKDPVAPNTNPDGSDNPAGRAKNRRVEVVIDTCK